MSIFNNETMIPDNDYDTEFEMYDQRDPSEIFDEITNDLSEQLKTKSTYSHFKIFVRQDLALSDIMVSAMRNVLSLKNLRYHYPVLKNFAVSVLIYKYGIVFSADKETFE